MLLLFDHREYNLYSILSELEQRGIREPVSFKLLPIFGSLRHPNKPLDLMKT
jgi:FlaA1/EpsC-like NDP-sugar epimerase